MTIRIKHLIPVMLLLQAAVSLAASKPQPCKLERWSGAGRPTDSTFGPDHNASLNLDQALKLTIPKGKTVYFLFWTNGPETENAMLLYDGAFGEVAKRKMAGGRD